MTHIIHTQADLDTAVGVLIEQDPRWRPVFEKTGMPAIRRREGGFAGLCSIVCGQQLSTASAGAIRARLFAAFDPFHHDGRAARADKLKRLGLSDRDRVIKSARIAKSTSIRRSPRWSRPGTRGADRIASIDPDRDIYLLFCLGNADARPATSPAEAARPPRAQAARCEMMGSSRKMRPWRGWPRICWAYYHG